MMSGINNLTVSSMCDNRATSVLMDSDACFSIDEDRVTSRGFLSSPVCLSDTKSNEDGGQKLLKWLIITSNGNDND